MLDEKKFIENFTKVPGIYNTIEFLKGDYKLSVESGIKKSGFVERLVYKSENKESGVMEISKNSDNQQVCISFMGGLEAPKHSITNIYIREDNVLIDCFDGEKLGQVFVVGDKINFYNQESVRAACIFNGGISHIGNVKQYEAVSVFPDSVIEALPEAKNLGERIFFAVSCVEELLSQENKKSRK